MGLDEKYQGLFRPTVHYGKIEIDQDKCIGCGQCTTNCPGDIPQLDENEKAFMGREQGCISCSNCIVVCPEDAITLVESFFIEDGYYKTTPADIPYRLPEAPLDADGNPSEFNAMEMAMFERRSVRNFKDDPVPEPLIRRIIEAGRFAPSAGNCQPWRFIVVTDQELLNEISTRIQPLAAMASGMYQNDEMLETLAAQFEADPQPGMFDPRVQGGLMAVGEGTLPALVAAPALIIILGDERSIGGPDLNIGICGQNMNLAALSLGLGACWVGFISVINMMPDIVERLGIEEPYKVATSMSIGYPAFKQSGIVAREAKPVTWFRPGGKGPEVEH
jgi:nitroreductase/NAD-dependent dihydropyrimidine dehydrogenase PreA subunit